LGNIIHEEILKFPLFSNISSNELSSLQLCLKPRIRTYKRNEYITIAGEKFDSIGLFLEGEATVNKENLSGNRILMARLKPGDMFGEALVFTGEAYWPSTIQAQTGCKVMFLSSSSIIGLCQKVCPCHKKLIQNMLKIISEKAVMLNKKVEYLTITSVREKLSKFLLEQYKKAGTNTFTIPLNRKELAEFLNVTRPSLSREMCRMRDEGIIDFHMASVKIIDLERMVC
jgi:CRP-like cAMP-binding protein